MSFTRHDVFMTEDEAEEAQRLLEEANNTPVIAINSAQALSGNDFATMAWKRLYTFISKTAVSHGLPIGKYGVDLESREFVS